MSIPPPGTAALVIGASSGIGAQLARRLAERGHDVVLAARRRDRLEELAGDLREQTGRRIEAIVCDVSDPGSRAALAAEIERRGLAIEVLVLSAGFGMTGPFTAHDPERLQLMLRTNFEGTVALTRAFAPAMQQRGRGGILLVSSMAGNQPMPNFGAYAATKAGLTSFAEMLHEEMRTTGVTVTALCPGEVMTEFVQSASVAPATRRIPAPLKMSAEDCAEAGLAALEAGRRKVTPRLAVKVFTFVGAHGPRRWWLRFCRRLLA